MHSAMDGVDYLSEDYWEKELAQWKNIPEDEYYDGEDF